MPEMATLLSRTTLYYSILMLLRVHAKTSKVKTCKMCRERTSRGIPMTPSVSILVKVWMSKSYLENLLEAKFLIMELTP